MNQIEPILKSIKVLLEHIELIHTVETDDKAPFFLYLNKKGKEVHLKVDYDFYEILKALEEIMNEELE